MEQRSSASILKSCAAAALCALAATAAVAQVNVDVPPMSREAFEATQPQGDPSLLPRMDHGDGTWSYQPGPQVTPDLQVHGGIVLWRYDGQARFSHEPDTQTGPGPFFRVVPQPEDQTPFEQLTSLVRIDQWGHRWRAEAADFSAWTAAIAAEDASSEEPLGGPAPPHEPPPQPGTVEWWEPHSWSSNNCNANRKKEERVWDGDGRTVISTPDVWESTAVQVNRGTEQCSGVILTQDFVLTSAHCVSDDRNRSVPTDIVNVCRIDTSSTACIDAADITFPSSYRGGSGSGGGTDFADDWALIELDSTWQAAGFSRAEDMDMSRASDSVIDGLSRIKNLGFPQFANGCTFLNGASLVFNDEREPIASSYRKSLRLKIDSGPGHSGGPVYYCPGGTSRNRCESGDKGFVIGVSAGWNGFAKRVVGPKVAHFRDAAMAILFD